MKPTITDKILLILLVGLLGIQYRYATTSACPANMLSKTGCWGPNGIEIFGINFNLGYLFFSIILLLISFVVTVMALFIIYKIKKKEEFKSKLFNRWFRIFSIVYILSSSALLYLNMSIVY